MVEDRPSKIPATITKALDKRLQEDSFRRLVDHSDLIDFASNDYLGLASNSELQVLISKISNQKEFKTGGTGSRLISGNTSQYTDLENQLANIFEAEAGLLFNSGYNANQGVLSCVALKGDTILYDRLAHICIKEGAWLSKADSYSFEHNDLDDLERRLKNANGTIFVVTESVFSMDGDFAPLKDIVELCNEYNAYVIVDEAHSTGVFGEKGSGLCSELGLSQDVFARIYTFGKAMGVHGAVVCGERQLIDYLINFSRPFIYTTSLPPHSLAAIEASFTFLSQHIKLQERLNDNISFFKNLVNPKSLKDSESAIQPVMIAGNSKCKSVAEEIQKRGFDVRAILAPTVKQGTERIRVSIHSNHTQKQIKELAESFNELI